MTRPADPERWNDLSGQVVEAAIRVHEVLGPGLRERVYREALAIEFSRRGLRWLSEVKIPVVYEGHDLGFGYRIDLIVEDCVVVELKALDTLRDVQTAQILTYLKFSGCPIGLLINFNHPTLLRGLRRVVNRDVDVPWLSAPPRAPRSPREGQAPR